MKHLKLLLLLAIMPLFAGCCWSCPDDDGPAGRWQNYEAVTMTRAELEGSIRLKAPQPMVKSGKIYIKDNLLFVNDVNRGFHIYAYDAEQQAAEIAYLEVPGATDIALRGTTLYINQATDLVTLAYANNAITLIKRNRDVFPQKLSPDGSWDNVAENEVITDWIPL